jgi:D-tyrosyl-tRNA(Tyr) deacylase
MRARVTVDGEVVGAIGRGLLLFVGAGEDDGEAQVDLLTSKIANLRIFEDDGDRMNRSLLDLVADGPATGNHSGAAVGALVVSQFTLYADVRKGRRPSFIGAAHPSIAEPLIAAFAERLGAFGIPVAQGRFGAEMAVELINDGPVTIWLDSADLQRPRPRDG